MRNGSRKAGGGSQLLRLAQNLFRFAFVSDVAKHQHHPQQLLAIVPDRCGAVFDGNQSPVDVSAELCGLPSPTTMPRAITLLTGFSTGLEGQLIEDGEDLLDLLPFGCGELVPVRALSATGFRKVTIPLRIGGDHCVANAGEGYTEPLLAVLQFLSVLFAQLNLAEDVIREQDQDPRRP
jgi:hypothetical protein